MHLMETTNLLTFQRSNIFDERFEVSRMLFSVDENGIIGHSIILEAYWYRYFRYKKWENR